MQTTSNIVQLRQILAEKFPGVRAASELRPAAERPVWATGVPALDDALGGGLPLGGMTELVAAHQTAGSAVVIHSLLAQTHARHRWLALVDGSDSFDPAPCAASWLQQLLWARCQEARQAMQAADLVLRDANFAAVVLDLRLNRPEELRRIPATSWYRFQRLAQHAGSALLVIAPRPLVQGAEARVALHSQFCLEDLLGDDARPRLEVELLQRRQQGAEALVRAG